MNIKCNGCGMINWATSEVCKRCRAPLKHEGITDLARQADAREQFTKGSRRGRKWILIVAMSAVVIVSLAFALIRFVLKSSAPAYDVLIQNSPSYRKTINILINRQNEIRPASFPDPQLQDIATPKPTLLPETLMLYHAGFLVFHEVGSPDASSNIFFSMNGSTIEPKSKEIESQWQLLERRMNISNSRASSSEWWVVPIGERAFRQITQTNKGSDFASATEFVEIKFTWNWKPNDAGRVLDKSDSSYTPPENIVGVGNWSAQDRGRMGVRDSQQAYDGYAKLIKKQDGSYVIVDLWFADFPDQHWPTNRDNDDHVRHNLGLLGF